MLYQLQFTEFHIRRRFVNRHHEQPNLSHGGRTGSNYGSDKLSRSFRCCRSTSSQTQSADVTYLDLFLKVALEAGEQDLALGGLKSVDEARNGSLVVLHLSRKAKITTKTANFPSCSFSSLPGVTLIHGCWLLNNTLSGGLYKKAVVYFELGL